MLLIAGLGNPGAKHQNHRHNVGFMAADAIARRHSFAPWHKKFKAELAEGRIAGEKVLLIKPQTFMNLSGQSVGEAMRFYKLGPADLIVFYDELDLAPGKVRVKTGGGHGGHNGIRSLDAHCGKDFRRVRIGIGHPGDKHKVTGHVLGDFAKADREWTVPLLDAIADNAELLVSGDDSSFMNRLSLAVAPVSKKAGKPQADTVKQDKKNAAGGQADNQADAAPPAGPMAGMLKKLFGGSD